MCELINNKIVMPPAPSYEHQDVSGELFVQLRTFAASRELGKVQHAPLDVYLSKENVFQPDILFIAKDRLHIVQDGKVKGAPDLVVEILSPGTENFDRKEKRDAYERFGVKEYWVVNADTKAVIGYLLKNGVYQQTASRAGIIASPLLGETFRF